MLLLIIILAALLRLYDLGGESYWYDEVIMTDVAQGDLGKMIKSGRPPLYVTFAHFWIKLFGTSEFATRSLSALAGILAIPVLYLIGQQLFGTRVGLISAFLMAISQFLDYKLKDIKLIEERKFTKLTVYLFQI